eukprot:3937329-Rhodomonas_salina.4
MQRTGSRSPSCSPSTLSQHSSHTPLVRPARRKQLFQQSHTTRQVANSSRLWVSSGLCIGPA